MKLLRGLFGVGIGLLPIFGWITPVSAADIGQPAVRQINITGGEYLVIENSGSGLLDLNNYWLGYSSDAKSIAGPSEQLPAVALAPGESIILSNGPVKTCGAVASGDLPFALANSGGRLSLWRADANQTILTKISALAWGKDQPTGSDYLNINDEDATDSDWFRLLSPIKNKYPAWQAGNLQDCEFTPLASSKEPTPISWPRNSSSPPFQVLPAKIIGATSPVLPASDKGLVPPEVSELLPNPASPQTDADNEFIELYNPNPVDFDLSGFTLETGSTTSDRRHDYKFASGAVINSESFEAFYSKDTSLSLTNGGGQVFLLDPLGKIISKSGVYGEAKDGLAFALAGNKWGWTILPTPGAANKVQGVASSTNAGSDETASIKGTPITAIKGASTVVSADNGSTRAVGDETPAPIHTGVLALVAILALAYGLWEYRNDLGNKFHQLRKYREARRANRR